MQCNASCNLTTSHTHPQSREDVSLLSMSHSITTQPAMHPTTKCLGSHTHLHCLATCLLHAHYDTTALRLACCRSLRLANSHQLTLAQLSSAQLRLQPVQVLLRQPLIRRHSLQVRGELIGPTGDEEPRHVREAIGDAVMKTTVATLVHSIGVGAFVYQQASHSRVPCASTSHVFEADQVWSQKSMYV